MTRAFIPSAAQKAYFGWLQNGEGNAIVEAVAGSGKSTTLVQGLDYMPGTAGFFAFNTTAGKELEAKIAEKLGVAPRTKTRAVGQTLHSYGLTHLRWAFGKEYKLEILKGNNDKTMLLLEQYVEANPHLIEFVKSIKTTVCKMVSMAKQRGIGIDKSITDMVAWLDMCDRFELADDLPEEVTIAQAVKISQEVLAASNRRLDVIDFDDMIYLPLQRKVRFSWTFDWVLLDEAQDTNPIRRMLAMKALKPNGRFVAVGDPRQAIYGFTGADNDALDQIAVAFNCTRLPLTVSYRCPQAVVAHARNWVSHIEAHQDAPVGTVTEEEYDAALKSVKPGDAMLCRFNAPLVKTVFKLIRAGIPAKIEGRDIGRGLIAITKKWKVKSLDAFKGRLEKWAGAEVAKAEAKNPKDEARIERVMDQVETLYVLIEKTVADGGTKVEDLVANIMAIFDDKVSDKGMVVLASVHKSKGLEWSKVYILGRAQLMPSKYAKQPWQLEQEDNLIYVAITRAKMDLVEVNMPVKDDKEKETK